MSWWVGLFVLLARLVSTSIARADPPHARAASTEVIDVSDAARKGEEGRSRPQSWAVWFAFALSAAALHVETFVGTLKEIGALFALGFFTDPASVALESAFLRLKGS